MAGIIAETLGIERVGADDDFFELGGHSLHATSVLAKIEATFGVAIELRRFFTAADRGRGGDDCGGGCRRDGRAADRAGVA